MHTEINFFFRELKRSYSSNYPFVVYRKPNTKLVSAYIQNSNEVYGLKSFTEKGFLFAPFNRHDKKIIFPEAECKTMATAINSYAELQIDSKKTSWQSSSTGLAKKNHMQLVQKALDFIKSKKAEKIVVSRKEILEILEFDAINTLKKMLKNYQNAFVYLWFHPVVGLWMGATPERFINIYQNKFRTMALASTRPYHGSTSVKWNKKEQQEQQFVTDFILEKIKVFMDEIKINGPYSVKAGNLVHLRTDISGNLHSENLLEHLINSLHPTPAVCGLPNNVATQFILQNEGYSRTFYSGFLGELNILGATNLYMNLRCMQLENKKVSIYVGGGITVDSNPKKEWEETVSKAEVIKKVL